MPYLIGCAQGRGRAGEPTRIIGVPRTIRKVGLFFILAALLRDIAPRTCCGPRGERTRGIGAMASETKRRPGEMVPGRRFRRR